MNLDFSSSSEFSIAYDGADLTDHTISVRDLAPVLLAADVLFQRANYLLNRNDVAVALSVRAQRPGSFEISFVADVLQAMTLASGSHLVSSAANLQRLLFGGSTLGLLTLIKRLRGRSPEVTYSFEDSKDTLDGTIEIEAEGLRFGSMLEADKLKLSIPAETLALFENRDIRKAISDLVSPLKRDGIDRMVVRDGAEILETVSEDDLPSFVTSSVGEDVVESIIPRQLLRVISPHFGERSRQWKLHDGAKVNRYTILDERCGVDPIWWTPED